MDGPPSAEDIMIPLRSHVLERPDAVIRYWTGGVSGAPTVVLLHGATLDHRSWQPQIDALHDRFRVVVTDLRGHGASTGVFDFDAAVEDILTILKLEVDSAVVLVGLSLGGNIAQEVVRRQPDLISGLVAADSTCNSADRLPLAAASTAAALRMHALWTRDGFARQAALASSSEPRVQDYIMEANANRSTQETLDILNCLLTSALRPDRNYPLPVPALLIHGQHDRVGDIVNDMRTWARREPGVTYAVIPNAGHTSNLDNPTVFTRLLIDFIDNLPEAAP